MMQHLATGRAGPRRPLAEDRAEMASALGALTDMSDSEAFALLRQRFPRTTLCERVAAVARWRLGP